MNMENKGDQRWFSIRKELTMKRKEKNELLKRMASKLDTLLLRVDVSPEEAAEVIGLLQECDEGLYLNNADRQTTHALKDGRLSLNFEVVKGG